MSSRFGIINTYKKTKRKIDIMSERKYSIKKYNRQHLTEEHRQKLAVAWNQYITKLYRISIREFAKIHHIAPETWRRELQRGAMGPIIRQGKRWIYPEYDPHKAQDNIDEGKCNMGTPMKMTVGMAILFRHLVLEEKRSPYDARQYIIKAFPDKKIPCLSTFYNHIKAGDMGVFYGDTPYHPGKLRRPKIPPHKAKTHPDHRTLADRPKEADHPTELGNFEMDTIVSKRGCHGGILVLIDKCSRYYLIAPLAHISQREVMRALRRMRAQGKLNCVRSITTDNGCEFMNQRQLDRFFKANVYYTRAYASWEKGQVENCNRLVRRWYPKGTDFSRLSAKAIQELEDCINSIHRASLNGATAREYVTHFNHTV